MIHATVQYMQRQTIRIRRQELKAQETGKNKEVRKIRLSVPVTKPKWVMSAELPIHQDDGKKRTGKVERREFYMVSPLARGMQPTILGLARVIKSVSFSSAKARPSQEQVHPTNFGSIPHMVQNIFPRMELSETYQAVRMRDISTKTRLDTVISKEMNRMSLA